MPAKYFAIPKKVNKAISKFPKRVLNRINQSFDTLKQNPIAGTKLGGQLSNYYKFRLGDYRIIYRFDAKNSTIVIEKIEHRQGVYK